MLGETALSRLSATDLWLLLEAAYLHDAGMMALLTTKRSDLESKDFEEHLVRLSDSADDVLAQAAQRLRVRHPRYSPVEILEGHLDLLVVYAEYVRARHPQRAVAVALDPSAAAGVASPRVSVLPNRFWHVIGDICRAHGETRAFVMNLPATSSGASTDLCHPRFVACMLRLGDLLDLDSDRFCPALNATIGALPLTSEAHRKKHAGIRHLLVNTNRIEVLGVYDDVDSYLTAESWFAMLRAELTDQLLHWDEIAPSKEIGPLPSAGTIEARLEGQIVFDRNARPRFEVDRDKLLQIVRGTNIYDGPHDAVREVLQNAIDATLLRHAYDAQCAAQAPPLDPTDLRARLKALPVDVNLERLDRVDGDDPESTRWRLRVVDHGIGMRLDDIRYLLRLGSSGRNPYRRSLVEWLPEWARPSGTFGIGFHSLFEYCQQVTVLTRHPEEPHGFVLRFEVTKDGADPHVIVRSRERGPLSFPPPSGTTVDAIFKTARLPETVSQDADSVEAMAVVERFDFVAEDDLPYAAARIADEISAMGAVSFCEIRLRGDPLTIVRPGDSQTIFFAEQCLELSLRDVSPSVGHTLVKYRGAKASGGWGFTLLILDVNMLGPDAREVLEISRNKLTRAGARTLHKRLNEALPVAVPRWLGHWRGRSDDGSRKIVQRLSLFAYLWEPTAAAVAGEEWKQVLVGGSESVTLGQVEAARTASFSMAPPMKHTAGLPPTEVPEDIRVDGDRAVLRDISGNRGLDGWLQAFLLRQFRSRVLDADERGTVYHLARADSDDEDVTDAGLRAVLRTRSAHLWGVRTTIPCSKAFAELRLRDGVRLLGLVQDPLIRRTMANPFVRRDRPPHFGVELLNLDSYATWVARQAGVPLSAVVTPLLAFIGYVDRFMGEEGWLVPKKYSVAEAEVRLAQVLEREGQRS